MRRYPSLALETDEERVAEIGGKAFVLEELIKRWPEANVPAFEVFDKKKPYVPLGSEEKVFRASSELDLFGGCGLYDTFAGVSSWDYSHIVNKILEPSDVERERINVFARSVGKEAAKPTIISQNQGTPDYWAVVMQHPNNPDVFLVNYSDGPSFSCKNAFLSALGTHNSAVAVARETFTAVYDSASSRIEGILKADGDKELIKKAVEDYVKIQGLGITDSEWVSILEAGFYPDSVEIYQFTPIRKKLMEKHDVPEGRLVFGATETIELPVVKLPRVVAIENYLNYGGKIRSSLYGEYSDITDFLERNKERADMLSIVGLGFNFLVWAYIKEIEDRYPQGYILLARPDKCQEFDITMTNAKAVLVDTLDDPLHTLNHNISRLVYKAPVMVVGNLIHLRSLNTGDAVKFSCDGSGYNITKK